jgi:hypothetical protein
MNAQITPLRGYAVEQRSPTTLQIETKQHQSIENTPKLEQENLPYVGLLFLMITFIVTVILLIFRYSRFGKMMAERTLTAGIFHKIPCRRCRYFSHNPYLSCAIHPSLALTEQAIDCPDYCVKEENTKITHDSPCS